LQEPAIRSVQTFDLAAMIILRPYMYGFDGSAMNFVRLRSIIVIDGSLRKFLETIV
jgi:hypothetical protein